MDDRHGARSKVGSDLNRFERILAGGDEAVVERTAVQRPRPPNVLHVRLVREEEILTPSRFGEEGVEVDQKARMRSEVDSLIGREEVEL